MFCSDCGTKASGRFCSQCGAKLPTQSSTRPEATISQTWDDDDLPDIGDTILDEDGLTSLSMYEEPAADDFDEVEFVDDEAPTQLAWPKHAPCRQDAGQAKNTASEQASNTDETLVVDWAYEVDYDTLAEQPWIRRQLQFAANRAKGGVSAEKWLGLFDNIVPGTSLVAIAVQPLYEQLGVQTGKSEAAVVAKPIGFAMFEVLKFLAENGQQLIEVQQAEDGCLLVATIPSDIWSFKGTLYVQLQFAGDDTRVELRTVIPGQMFDWGKSTRLLDRVLGALRDAA